MALFSRELRGSEKAGGGRRQIVHRACTGNAEKQNPEPQRTRRNTEEEHGGAPDECVRGYVVRG